eukprot:jgi/Chrpa1/24356/Chrysochromulina_OHIO_Genome00022375-RA
MPLTTAISAAVHCRLARYRSYRRSVEHPAAVDAAGIAGSGGGGEGSSKGASTPSRLWPMVMRLRGAGDDSLTSIRSDPDSLADALFDAIAAARVPKGTLDVPVRPHARRLPSGRRGITCKMLRAIRRFFRARGALGMLMGDLIKKEGFEW